MELLKLLYSINSPSGGEKKMKKFIRGWVFNNFPNREVKFNYDNRGNIYLTKGKAETYPCVVAHLDQVQEGHSNGFVVYETDGLLHGFDPATMKQAGLGADDKNGIWVALKCLLNEPVLKIAFFVSEEIGCVGSAAANMKFFDDCRWVVQCDRRNGFDFIQTASWTELCDKSFYDKCEAEKFGYKIVTGAMTDVMTLKQNGLKVACCNLSCGYHSPHTEHEVTDTAELLNCLTLVRHIIATVTEVVPHDYTPRSFAAHDDDYDTPRSYYSKNYWKSWYKKPSENQTPDLTETHFTKADLIKDVMEEVLLYETFISAEEIEKKANAMNVKLTNGEVTEIMTKANDKLWEYYKTTYDNEGIY